MKSHTTIMRHQEDKLSKATSSIFPIKMIAKLKWTQNNIQQNIEQLQTSTMGVTINKKSTTTEPPGCVEQSVTCLASGASLPADSGVPSSILAWFNTFVEIDHKIISRVILLPSAEYILRRVVVSYK